MAKESESDIIKEGRSLELCDVRKIQSTVAGFEDGGKGSWATECWLP